MAIVGVGKVTAKGRVVFGYQFEPVAPVSLVFAGSAQTVLCSALVVLEGITVGGVNNVYLWEQLSGDPITIDNPTNLTTFFTNSGGSDVVVRLWVDKGLDTEMYDDLEVTRTPSTWHTAASGHLANLTQFAADYDAYNWKYYATQRGFYNIIYGPAESEFPQPGDEDDGLSCTEISASALGIFWDLPTDIFPSGTATYTDYLLGLYISTVVEKYNTNTSEWEQEAEYFDGSTVRNYTLEYDELYRLGNKYDFELNPVFIQYNDPFFVTDDPTQLYKMPLTSIRIAGAGDLSIHINSLKRITASLKEFTDSHMAAGSGDLSISTGTIKRLTATIVTQEDSHMAAGSGYMALGGVTVTRSNGGSIGG